jgi:hypothetical protein
LTLFPQEDVLLQEIESWKGFAESLPEQDKEPFLKMFQAIQKYSRAINSNSQPFPYQPLLMALLLEQHKLIIWLTENYNRTTKN